MTLVRYSSAFDCSAEDLFAFHTDPANLPRISPWFASFRLISGRAPAQEGDLQEVELGFGPVRRRFVARIVRVVPGALVEDVQEEGDFLRWRHQHRVRATETGSELTDVVAFRLLPTPAGEFVEWLFGRAAMHLLFRYRHRQTRRLLAADGASAVTNPPGD